MKHRSSLSKKEWGLRNRLRKLIADADGFAHGSIIRMARRCGNPNCRCATKEKKHVSKYLGQTRKGRTYMKYIPKDWEARINRWVQNYKQASELLEQISKESWDRLRKKKE